MSATTEAGPRFASLDVVRGVAVMGILAMNIVAFAMPFQAYMNPTAYGLEGPADFWSWVFSFIFIDGRMRGLFSFLFGASALLVLERAEASGASPAMVHYARMFTLLCFGLLHFYFIWFGDILVGYAMMGLLLYFFRRLEVRNLVIWGVLLIGAQLLMFGSIGASMVFLFEMASAPGADPEIVRQAAEVTEQLGAPTAPQLAAKLELFRGTWSGLIEDRLIRRFAQPFTTAILYGPETLGYMLLGMAALKSGFFTGEWSALRYRRIALIGFAVGAPAYALLAWILVGNDFSIPTVFLVGMAATVPFRPVMVVAYAAAIILLAREGGALVDRIAAAGRAAFTNYLGTSILMTTLFYGYGFGMYGRLSRAETWIVVLAMWALMLLWSKPWLDRFRYGPFEWLWRSLSRGRIEPMSKAPAAA